MRLAVILCCVFAGLISILESQCTHTLYQSTNYYNKYLCSYTGYTIGYRTMVPKKQQSQLRDIVSLQRLLLLY